MQYKSITLELLESHPDLAGRLKAENLFTEALEICSTDLRTRSLELTDQLAQSHPYQGREELSYQAFEIALRELEGRVRFAAQPDLPPQPGQLIEFLRRHTPAA